MLQNHSAKFDRKLHPVLFKATISKNKNNPRKYHGGYRSLF
jgi:hypothetical protein